MPNHVSTALRIAVYQQLFNKTFVVVEKDNKEMHPTFEGSNLHVWMLCRSLMSRGLVRETFNWNHHYFFATEEGLSFLREFFSLEEGATPEIYVEAKKAEETRAAKRADRDSKKAETKPEVRE